METTGYALLVLFGLEQLCCWLFLPYPYRYGIPLKRIPVTIPEMVYWRALKGLQTSLDIHMKKSSDEVFLRHNYACPGFGPLFFIGYVKQNTSPVMIIRVGWCTALGIVCLALSPFRLLLTSDSFPIGYALLMQIGIILFIAWTYSRFIDAYKITMKMINRELKNNPTKPF